MNESFMRQKVNMNLTETILKIRRMGFGSAKNCWILTIF